MTRPFWIGTSWKMNKTLSEARAYAQRLQHAGVFQDPRLQGFVIPPFTALAQVCADLAQRPILVGAQNMHWADAGAFTGEISPAMVTDCGADLVELGHSERRQYFGETDSTVNRKVLAALRHGLRPLICIGESAEERRLGAAAETVLRQARMAIHGVPDDQRHRLLLAYEPVWAIGEGGRPATPEDVNPIHALLARELPATADGACIPVLYGGSVNLDNAVTLARLPEVAGLFIGRSAWDADGYVAISEQVLRHL